MTKPKKTLEDALEIIAIIAFVFLWLGKPVVKKRWWQFWKKD